jgi:ATP adenylyltransferase
MMACKICSDLCSKEPAFWNVPLFESANFRVLPSLGALVEGWLLLLPKQHVVSMGALDDELVAEMQHVKNLLVSPMERAYSSVCAFEHGPSKANSLLGCGVDHAHLHIVALKFDLLSAVQPFLPKDVSWSPASFAECKTLHRKGDDYLYLEQPIGLGRIASHREFGSQLFRRAIAAQIGVPDQFSWREHPQFSNISATIQKTRTWAANLDALDEIKRVAA